MPYKRIGSCAHDALVALLIAAEEGLVAFDADGMVVCATPPACTLLGCEIRSPIGEHYTALPSPEIASHVERALSNESHALGRFTVTVGERELACRLSRSRASDRLLVLVMQDQTELAEERERNEAVLAAAADGLVLMSLDDHVTYANPAACRMLSTTPRRLIGSHTTVAGLLGEEPLDDAEELEIELKGQQHLVVRARVTQVIDSGGVCIGQVLSMRDVTAELEIAQMKTEFVSTVSHELRTPLTSIKGYVDLILDGDAGEVNEIQREFLGIVKENSDRLVNLINDMLDISRIESGRVHLRVEPVSINDSIAGAIATFQALLTQTGRTVTAQVADGLPMVAADRDRVGQVLVNLISNALKYSPGGGEVEVMAKREGGFVSVSVIDHGMGISKSNQKRLFTKFYRVDSAITREIGGTGLGLSICKNVIELLGGSITVKSRAGSGSTFTFHLPVAPSELVRTPWLEGPGEVGGTVLVVDGNPEAASLIETYLVKRGYSVVKAGTAEDALQAALTLRPRVITLDVILHGADGFELLQRLKEDPRTSDIPVVVLSIVCDEGRSCRLGAADYLEKPIEQERLGRLIDDMVGGVSSPVALVVDDDRDTVRLLSETLRKKGFAVIAAFDGAEAIAAIEQRIPDIVISDLKMPKVDGYQLIQRVKTTPEWADIPIVIMTAHQIDRSRIDVVDMAALSLQKPFPPEAIADKVEALLRGTRPEVATDEPHSRSG